MSDYTYYDPTESEDDQLDDDETEESNSASMEHLGSEASPEQIRKSKDTALKNRYKSDIYSNLSIEAEVYGFDPLFAAQVKLEALLEVIAELKEDQSTL